MASGTVLKRASSSTIQDKFLVGYQGWYTCAGDGEPIDPGHSGWLHWFDGKRPNIDTWPDVSSYSPSELFPARDLKLKTGEQAFLFSSRHPKTVQRHFHWMAEHGVDGVFLQRFAGQCTQGNEGIRRLRDEVGQRVREAAEKEGRVFAIMYDVSGVPAYSIQRILERDWQHLIRKQCILDSPNYLKEKGRPVIGLWGFGFNDAEHAPDLVSSIIKFFRATTPGGAYIFGGAPAGWRLSEGDADMDHEFVDVYLDEFDAISPWTIGRFKNEEEADNFAEFNLKGDMDLIKKRNEETGRKVDYVPVVYPGGSGYNMSKGKWEFNDAPRNGGKFLWKQVFNAKRLGVRTLYGAMWDEYDEGTAFMPIVEHKHNLPQSDEYRFMALDEDGQSLPSDWYMRICGMAAEGLRSERWIHETFPLKELHDYWSSRPKYEKIDVYTEKPLSSSSASSAKPGAEAGGSGGDGDGQSYQQWLASQNDDKDEPPPPPYTLIDDESSTAAPAQAQQAQVATVAPVPPSTVQASPVATPPTVPASQAMVSSQASPNVSPTPPIATTSSSAYSIPGQILSASITPVSQAPSLQGRPNVTVPVNNTPAHTPSHGSSTPTSPGFQAQRPQPVQPATNTVDTLASDFGRANIAGSSGVPPTRQDTPPFAGSRTSILGGRLANTPSPPQHPAYPALNKPSGYGRPSISRPPQHSPPMRPSSVHGQSSGSWSSSQWPPKEWGVNADAPPAPSGGANLSRPQTFTASSSSYHIGGTNLRPSATISGHTHNRPSVMTDHPTPPVHVPAAAGYPQSAVSEYPPVGFPNVPTHSDSPPPGVFGSGNYHPAGSSYDNMSPPLTHRPSPPLGGFGSGNYPTASSYNMPQYYDNPGGGYMPMGPHMGPSPPFHPPHVPVFPQPSMPTPWGPPESMGHPGPMGPTGPMIPLGPIGPVGPGAMQPGPQYVYGSNSNYAKDSNKDALDYALSAVDMVAGRKTRNQIQNLASKYLR